MTPPEHGHAALYIKCPVCASWNLHVAGTEGAVAGILNAPRFNGWRCDVCGTVSEVGRDPELRRAALDLLLAYEAWRFSIGPDAAQDLRTAMDALKEALAK